MGATKSLVDPSECLGLTYRKKLHIIKILQLQSAVAKLLFRMFSKMKTMSRPGTAPFQSEFKFAFLITIILQDFIFQVGKFTGESKEET